MTPPHDPGEECHESSPPTPQPLAAGAFALLALACIASAAFAIPPPRTARLHSRLPPPATIVTGGMPGWQITLIAAAAALPAAAAMFLDRAWTVRRAARRTNA
jgi:hypothetical protein